MRSLPLNGAVCFAPGARRPVMELQKEAINAPELQNSLLPGAVDAGHHQCARRPVAVLPARSSQSNAALQPGEEEAVMAVVAESEADVVPRRGAERSGHQRRARFLREHLQDHQVRRRRRPTPPAPLTPSRYTLWSFVPKNLFEQFRRFTNIYFLMVVIITLIPQISPITCALRPPLFLLPLLALSAFHVHRP